MLDRLVYGTLILCFLGAEVVRRVSAEAARGGDPTARRRVHLAHLCLLVSALGLVLWNIYS